jgi:catechol 2,3-dioxygenase-like lactoylglutathione lyase family enzyme
LRRTASFSKETFLATIGINHLGLTVRELDQTTAFFTDCLGWALLARDDSLPAHHRF